MSETNIIIDQLRRLLNLPANATSEAEQHVEKALPSDVPPDIRNLCALFFDCVDVRFSANGLLFAFDGMRDILNTILETHSFSTDSIAEVGAALTYLEEMTGRLPEIYGGKPRQNKNIIIFLLTVRRRQILKLPDGQARWQQLGLIAYLTSRGAVNSSIKTQNKLWREQIAAGNDVKDFVPVNDQQSQESARAVSKVICFADLYKIKESAPEILPKEIIEDALNNAKDFGAPFDTMYCDYLKWSVTLFAGNELQRSRYKVLGKTYTGENYNEVLPPEIYDTLSAEIDQILSEPDQTAVEMTSGRSSKNLQNFSAGDKAAFSRWWNHVAEQISEGAAPDEFSSPPVTAAESLTLRAILGRRYRGTLVSGWTPVWAKSVLTQESLGMLVAELYSRAVKSENLSSAEWKLLVFVCLQISFGFGDRFLMRLRAAKIDEGLAPTDEHPLLYRGGYLLIKPQKYDGAPLFGAEDRGKSDICRPSGHIIRLKIPPFLTKLIENYLLVQSSYDDYLFLSEFAEPVLLEHSIALEIKKLNSQFSELRRNLHEKVDLAKIGRSGAIHLTAYGNLDDVLAALVKGEIPQHLGAQGHYINFRVDLLQCKYDDAFALTWQRLCEKSESLINFFDLTPLSELRIFCDRLPSPVEILNPPLSIGSPFVPLLTVFREYLGQLNNCSITLDDPIDRFNCRTAFVMLILMISLGIRADEDANLIINSFCDNDQDQMSISGKSNLRYAEWRISMLPAPVADLVRQYLVEADEITKLLSEKFSAYPHQLLTGRNNYIFFFISQQKTITPVTSKSLKHFLMTKLPKKTGIKSYRWKINAPRHLYATTALHLGIPRAEIDWLTGHTSQGREALSSYSLLASGRIRLSAERVSREILNQLDIFSLFKQQFNCSCK